MKYLCLIYDQESIMEAMPKKEMDAFMGEYFSFSDTLAKSGKMLADAALDPVHTATTVRIRQGKLTTTDGPFAETKEQLGGFYLVEAVDLNEAIQIASRIPSSRFRSIEVRPVTQFPSM